MQKIYWSEEASNDLEQIYDFISQNSIQYSIKTVKAIVERTYNLIKYPCLGRKIPEINDDNLREFIYKSYRIMYKIDSEVILILRVWHSARKLSKRHIPK